MPTIKQTAQAIGDYAGARIARLQGLYLGERTAPRGRAELARLRHFADGDGSWIGTGETLFAGWPQELGLPFDDSREFRAVSGAMCLYAVHQAGRPRPMAYVPGDGEGRWRWGLGYAARRVQPDLSKAAAVQRRLSFAEAADTFDDLLDALRGLVRMMRSASVPCNYSLLARDLYLAQDCGSRQRVVARWASDYFGARIKQDDKTDQEK